MASYKSNYLDNKILNAILNHTTYTPPTTLYLALFTVRPTAAGTGGTEVSGPGYVRLAVTANTTSFPTTSTESISNSPVLTFATATGSWGIVTAAAIMDAPSGGNYLYIGDLTSPVSITVSGTVASFQANALTVTEA